MQCNIAYVFFLYDHFFTAIIFSHEFRQASLTRGPTIKSRPRASHPHHRTRQTHGDPPQFQTHNPRRHFPNLTSRISNPKIIHKFLPLHHHPNPIAKHFLPPPRLRHRLHPPLCHNAPLPTFHQIRPHKLSPHHSLLIYSV